MDKEKIKGALSWVAFALSLALCGYFYWARLRLPFVTKTLGPMPVWAWLTGLEFMWLNDLVQRTHSLRAMTLVQLVPNFLKDYTPLGKLPLFGKLLELLDTPQAPETKAPLGEPPQPPPLPPAA